VNPLGPVDWGPIDESFAIRNPSLNLSHLGVRNRTGRCEPDRRHVSEPAPGPEIVTVSDARLAP